MIFHSERVAFGRHETFPLRFSWLPKSVIALAQDPRVFEADDSTVRLGVGRNMVNSMRYWLRAAQITEPEGYKMTEVGRLVLSDPEGFDPYLEDEGSIWLLHWLIASNTELATAFFWFFNKFHKTEFSSDELVTALGDFTQDQVVDYRRPAKNTVKSDAAVIPRMYTQSKITQRMPLEDALDSPFSVLKLVEHKSDQKIFVSRFAERPSLPVEVLGYAVLELIQFRGVSSIPIEDLMYSKDDFVAPGSIFRISENDFVRKLERLVAMFPESLIIRESNGIHQLFLIDGLETIDLLKAYYQRQESEAA